jgi:hypothetical protein
MNPNLDGERTKHKFTKKLQIKIKYKNTFLDVQTLETPPVLKREHPAFIVSDLLDILSAFKKNLK